MTMVRRPRPTAVSTRIVGSRLRLISPLTADRLRSSALLRSHLPTAERLTYLVTSRHLQLHHQRHRRSAARGSGSDPSVQRHGFGLAFDGTPRRNDMPMLRANDLTATRRSIRPLRHLMPCCPIQSLSKAIGRSTDHRPGRSRRGERGLRRARLPEHASGGADPGGGDGQIATIPSLHRAELVRYWMQQIRRDAAGPDSADQSAAEDHLAIGRSCCGPSLADNPNFTGSNPYFNPASGTTNPISGITDHNPNFPVHVPGFNPMWDGTFVDNYNSQGAATADGICDYQWDVDNDGDGQTDSVWVDLGLPVRSTADGRQYKPLVAILCVDMDGRLNLNAHGSLGTDRCRLPGRDRRESFSMLFAAGGRSRRPRCRADRVTARPRSISARSCRRRPSMLNC